MDEVVVVPVRGRRERAAEMSGACRYKAYRIDQEALA